MNPFEHRATLVLVEGGLSMLILAFGSSSVRKGVGRCVGTTAF